MSTVAPEMNHSKTEAFAERMIGAFNDAAVTLMTSIGHRTGLFDVMAEMEPATSGRIAERAGLNERYVREWLGAMVTGRIVEFNEVEGWYRLPREHAAVLTRAAVPNNLASVAQWMPLFARVESEIIECFENGGGVHYCCYHGFHDMMAEESNQTVVAGLLEHILPLAPGVRQRLEHGIDAADIGCGAGRALLHLAEAFPGSRFTGFDMSQEAVARGNATAQERGLSNVRFEVQDAAVLDAISAFDLIFAFDAIHDQAQPARVLDNIHRALRDEGVFLMQDIGASSYLHRNMEHPLGPFLYTTSCMHCMSVSLAQDGAGLGAVWGEELAVRMLSDAGFTRVDVRRLPHDMINNYYIVRK